MLGNRGGSVGSSSRMQLPSDDIDYCADESADILDREIEVWQGDHGSYDGGSGFGVHSEGLIPGAVPVMSFLFNDNPESFFKDTRQLHVLRKSYSIPNHVALHAPGRQMRANFYAPGWVCLYQAPFEQGMRLPLPRLVIDFCHYHCLSPGQLTPNSWRLLLSLQVFSELHGFDISIADVKSTYDLLKVPKDKGRYKLCRNKGCEPLITDMDDGERAWKSKYFFVEYGALCIPEGKRVPSVWSNPSCLKTIPVVLDLVERNNRFLQYPPPYRSWRVILHDLNIRQSSIWAQVPAPPEDGWMADLKFHYNPNEVDTDAFVARQLKRKKKKQASSSGVPTEPPIVTDAPRSDVLSGRSSRKRTPTPDDGCLSDGSVHVVLPVGASAHTEYNALSGQLEKLLLEEDRAVLNNYGDDEAYDVFASSAFAHYQHAIFMKQARLEHKRQLQDVRAAKARIENELVEAQKLVKQGQADLESLEASLQAQLASKDEEISRLKAELAEMEKNRELELLDACHEAVLKSRADMSQEVLDGSYKTWDNAENIRQWKVYQDKLSGVASSGDVDGDE
ncbi:uncharacterized protein LOC131026250 isoform X2 [Salvia miltiorrhiza]|uniref:uncharacterized protein LOC131026250 isoform X2 n=1 Tax=Salvia miltiorrhiza TaxID=226208 RepID=UPI0025AC5D8D|nr:uncharacterized protein LOC131026250 isoform X2 [Salvia miltiorrhiza]